MARSPEPPADNPETESRQTLRRLGGDKGLSLTERLSTNVAARLYATPLHAMRLRGRYPLKLLGVAADPVPGDPAIGERIAAGRLIHAGHTAFVRDLDFAAAHHPARWREWADGWCWLRDLAAHVPDVRAATALAEPLAARWLGRFAAFEPVAWRADITGQRLLMALSHAPLILSSPDQVYRSLVLSGIATWARHLDRAAFRLPEGLGRALALAGLWAAGLLLPGGETRAARALAGLESLLPELVLPDGGIYSRAPIDALHLAELLLHAGGAAEALEKRPPLAFAEALGRLVPALRGMALGDGIVGAWAGSAALPAAALARLSSQVASGTALSKGGGHSGYHRLGAGKTIVLVDAGPPALARMAPEGHAGTLAFEMSDGPQRLIVNCGGQRGLAAPLPAALADGLRTTAAHSTLTIENTNSTRIRDDGSLGLGVETVDVESRASSEGFWLEASHDGYARRFGLTVRRRLWLSPDGLDLRGEDALEPAPVGALKRRGPRPFDIRFHLGPDVAATPTVDGSGALLKLPGGRLWQMKARGGALAIEPSLWVDPAGQLHKTSQLVISGTTDKGAATIGWSLKRAGR
ncbi:heparinase II/III family protein [Polymorphobacter sp.]|uniref:heparinase II/III family protein n=1 Tax=Polymorphobacter sp. TaxID=1909290 RepID=UPI003F72718F